MKSIVIVNPIRYTGYGYVTIISKFFSDYIIIALWTDRETKEWAVNGAMHLIDMHFVATDYDDISSILRIYDPQCFLVGEDGGFNLADKLQCEFFPDYCNDPTKIDYRTSKYEYLRYLKQSGVVTTNQFILSNDTIESCRSGSWVVKPSNGAGNINVHINPSYQLIEKLLTTNETYMVQEFVEGPEYCMEICSYQGVHRCTMASLYKGEYLADDVYPWREENELISPDDPNIKILYDYVVSILDTLGVRLGLTWTQVKINNGVPNLVEINFRSQGRATLGPIYNVTGTHWARQSLLAYLKLPTSQPLMYSKLGDFNKVCVNNYREKLIEQMDWSRVENLPGVAWCEKRNVDGKVCPVTTNFTNTLGVIMIQSNDSAEYQSSMNQINLWKRETGQ